MNLVPVYITRGRREPIKREMPTEATHTLRKHHRVGFEFWGFDALSIIDVFTLYNEDGSIREIRVATDDPTTSRPVRPGELAFD